MIARHKESLGTAVVIAPDIAATTPAPPRAMGVRELAAQATRDAILRAATSEFAKHGFAEIGRAHV